MKLVPYIILRKLRWMIDKVFSGDLEEAISIGNLGLLMAARSFDPSKDLKFTTYASKVIFNRVLITARPLKNKADVLSYDALMLENAPDSFENTMGAIDPGFENVELKEDIKNVIKILNDSEKQVMKALYEGKKQCDIAKEMNVSQANISKIFQHIKQKWKGVTNEKNSR